MEGQTLTSSIFPRPKLVEGYSGFGDCAEEWWCKEGVHVINYTIAFSDTFSFIRCRSLSTPFHSTGAKCAHQQRLGFRHGVSDGLKGHAAIALWSECGRAGYPGYILFLAEFVSCSRFEHVAPTCSFTVLATPDVRNLFVLRLAAMWSLSPRVRTWMQSVSERGASRCQQTQQLGRWQ